MPSVLRYCSVCPGKKFESDTTYQDHINSKKHKAALESRSLAENQSSSSIKHESIDCPKGSEAGSTVSNKDSSLRVATQSLSAKCLQCGEVFGSHDLVEQHRRAMHPMVLCCKRWVYKKDIQTHYNNSVDHPKCGVCYMGFTDMKSLNEHECRGQPFRCKICNLSFPSEASNFHLTCKRCCLCFEDLVSHREHVQLYHSSSSPPRPPKSIEVPVPHSEDVPIPQSQVLGDKNLTKESAHGSAATLPRPPSPSVSSSAHSGLHFRSAAVSVFKNGDGESIGRRNDRCTSPRLIPEANTGMIETPIDHFAPGSVAGTGTGSSSGDNDSTSERQSEMSENDLPILRVLDAVSLQGFLSSRVQPNSQSDCSEGSVGLESGEEQENEANSSDGGPTPSAPTVPHFAAYRCQSFDNASAGSQDGPFAIRTPSDLRSVQRVAVGSGSSSQPLAGDVSPGALQPPKYTTSKHKSRQRFLYRCRLCQRDPEDPSVLFCGHLFCHRCIVEELATNFACPVCKKVVLTKLDLEQM